MQQENLITLKKQENQEDKRVEANSGAQVRYEKPKIVRVRRVLAAGGHTV